MKKTMITKHGTVVEFDVSPDGLSTGAFTTAVMVVIALALWVVGCIGYLIVKAAM